jgi:hypothetical protein
MRTLLPIFVAAFSLAGCPSPAPAVDANVTDSIDAPDASQDAARDNIDASVDADDGALVHIPDGATLHTLTAQFPNVPLTPSEETTLCVQVALDNTTPQLVRRGRATLAPGSHHIIIYRMPSTAPTWSDPQPCSAFSGVTDMAPAMLMAQASSSDLTFPDGVGLEIDAHQIIRIEEHFINLSGTMIVGTGSITFDAIDPVPGVVHANMFFWGPLGINIAPHATGSADFFHPVSTPMHIFALSTHQHHLGTLATVSQTTDATTPGTEVYRNTNWSEPPIRQYMPPLSLDGTTGIALHCEWSNTTSLPVMWGESAATDEMCFVGGYYYPSHGFDYCVDSLCSTL